MYSMTLSLQARPGAAVGHAGLGAGADVLRVARGAPRPVQPRLQRRLRPEQPLRRARPVSQPPGTDDDSHFDAVVQIYRVTHLVG